ncbi:hypothetical protein DFS34DRAFT_658671 [Phlyctochytrium arcticum]|nr:hypothetical protein DFS34DRAFT_658671 [Phlyctochytrium arcticum]
MYVSASPNREQNGWSNKLLYGCLRSIPTRQVNSLFVPLSRTAIAVSNTASPATGNSGYSLRPRIKRAGATLQETAENAGPSSGSSSSRSVKRRASEIVDLREEAVVNSSDVLVWARDSITVQTYLQKAIVCVEHGDVRTKQQGRHLIRLCRDARCLDRAILENEHGLPATPANFSTGVYKYDVSFIIEALTHDSDLVDLIKIMVKKGLIVNSSSWTGWLWNRDVPPSSIRRSMLPYLLETVAGIEPSRTDLDEQDIRSMWAAITRSAITDASGVGISLEFKHAFSNYDSFTKSDITIHTIGTKRNVGTCIAEHQIKAPGETAQQFISFLYTARVEDWGNMVFHYALVSQWSIHFYSLDLVELDDRLWFAVKEGPSFRIGPDLNGLVGVLQYGEYLNEVIVPACKKVRELVAASRGMPDPAIITRLPSLESANMPRSRTSTAPVTPSKKRRSI